MNQFMSISKFLPLRAVFALVVVFSNIASPVRAAQKELPLDEWKNLFNVVEGLEINPKLITTPSGGDTTFGVEYKFQREIRPQGLGFISGETELGISLRSEGLIVAEVDKSPNHLISHGLRISAIDLLPAQWTKNTNALRENAALRNRVDKGYYQLWKADAEELIDLKPETDGPRIAALRRNMDRLANEGAEELKDYGTLKPDPAARLWWLKTGRGLRDWGSQVAGKVVKERLLFLNFDLDGNLEHDQALTNVQFVGSAQLRGKFLIPELDWPFKVLRFGDRKSVV